MDVGGFQDKTAKTAIWTELTVRDDGTAECLRRKKNIGLQADVVFEKKQAEP